MIVKTENALNCTLASKVLGKDGRLILPEGVALSEALVSALLKQKITKVDITPLEGDVELNDNAEDKEFIEHVNFLFIRHRGQFMKEFKACLLKKS